MYAVIVTGGKQYKISAGETMQIEKLNNEVGSRVEFDQVLMIVDESGANIGTPYLTGATVIGEVSDQFRADKLQIIKFRRRKHYMRKQGHRQYLTAVKITEIVKPKS